MNSVKFFDVKVHSVGLNDAITALEDKQIIFTLNPEIILESKKNKSLRKALKSGTLMLPDGHGLQFVSTLEKFRSKFVRALLFIPALCLFLIWKKPFKKVIPDIIHGSDFLSIVISWAELNDKSVFFLGGRDDVAKKTSEYFKSTHSKLKIAGFSNLGPSEEAFKLVRKTGAEIIFVAYGAPKQEIWIDKYAKKLKKAHVLMAVGGSFDFWSGSIKRAPKILQNFGLEWLWRLIRQPFSRSKRIWKALIVFPITSLFSS